MEYLYFLQNLREACPPFINYFFIFISEVLVSGLIIVPAIEYWCINKKNGLWMLMNYSGAYMTNQVVKNTACIYRPWIRDSRLYIAPQAVKSATGYSFPSGHTVLGTSILGSVAVLNKKRKVIPVLCAIGILLVAFARNWLGAHTQWDVAAAIIETSVVMIMNGLLIKLVESCCEKNLSEKKFISFDVLFLGIGLLVTIMALLFLQFKNYPIDYDANGNVLVEPYKMITDCYTGGGLLSGFFIGWFLERRFIRFEIADSKKSLILRGVIGAIGLALLYALILPGALYFVEDHLKHFIKYFIIMIYVLDLFPLCFKLIEKKVATRNKK